MAAAMDSPAGAAGPAEPECITDELRAEMWDRAMAYPQMLDALRAVDRVWSVGGRETPTTMALRYPRAVTEAWRQVRAALDRAEGR